MTATATALNGFFSSFGMPAWPEGSVPEAAKLPYITYTLTEPEWDESAMLQVRVWTRSDSFGPVNAATAAMLARVGRGVLIPAGSGRICIRPGSPLAQHMPMPGDPELKVAYLNFQLNSYHMQGE